MDKKAKRISMEKAYLIFSKELHGHQDLGFLAPLAENGRVLVNIIDSKKVPTGTTICFTPISQPGVQRWALSKHFLDTNGKPLTLVL
jgi:hypothetical protein